MGGRVRNLSILQALSLHFEIETITLVHDRDRMKDPGPVASLGVWTPVLAWHRQSPVHRLVGQVGYRVAGTGYGREAWFLASRSLARAVRAAVERRPPAIVHVAYWFTLRHLAGVGIRPPVWILDTHDIQFERHARLGRPVSSKERGSEIREWSRYDRLIAITPQDEEALRGQLGPEAQIATIGMGVDLSHWRRGESSRSGRERDAGTIAFYGNMASEANRVAARHLCEEILPMLRRTRAGVQVLIVGADPPPDVRRLGTIPGVRVTGTVADPRRELAGVDLVALTIPQGSGIRSRVCEVMAMELPVVAYPGALEGMGFEEERDYLAARAAGEFAAQIDRLLGDPALARRLARSALDETARRYSVAATYGQFASLYRGLLDRTA
ncbi:MAG: glycosyltransferase [Candidatus Eisenbacteria bacterium]|nr:glycosyltransferase [Candidatus Eisenbacteria bacterium]